MAEMVFTSDISEISTAIGEKKISLDDIISSMTNELTKIP
jgi:hypothetical protein